MTRSLHSFIRLALAALAIAPALQPAANAQLTVIDPSNLVQNALNAARALEQINNQVQQITHQISALENDALNLARLGTSVAPEIFGRLRDMDALIEQARGIALRVAETRAALETLYRGDYRGTDLASRAQAAAGQVDAARSALQASLLLQAQATEQLRDDAQTLAALAEASAGAQGALSSQQAANELLAFQAQQTMRLQALLVAQSRAEALEQAREMEIRAQARAQHDHFFGGATRAHPGQRPWN